MAVALKMKGIRAAEAALFFLERLATAVIILLHGETPLLLVINLLLFAATSILYTVPYLARLHLGRPYSHKSDDKRYFSSEQLGLFFVVIWMLGGCSYGLTLGRAVLIYKNLVYFFYYLGYIISEGEDDDDDETEGKVEDNQIEQKEEVEYQVVEDNVDSSNDKETEKKETSAEFPQVVITSFEDWLCVDVNGTQDNKNNDDKDEKDEKEKVDGDGDGDVDEEEDDYHDEGEEEEEDDNSDYEYDDEKENGSNDDDDEEEDEKENEDGDSEEEEEEGRKDEKEGEGEGEGVADTENATVENKVEEELQELRVEFDNLKKEKDLSDQALKRAQEFYDNLKHRTRTYSNKLKTDMETAMASSEYTKKVALQLIKHLLKRYFNIQAQLADIKSQVLDFEESRRDWIECKERLTAERDAAVQSLDSYRDVIRDFEEAYDNKIKEKNSLIADIVNARLGKSSQ